MDSTEVLKNSTIHDNIIKLPNVKLTDDIYREVKKKLELIGGKWKGGKTSGFVFQKDPTELYNKIIGGEKVNIKKQYQFYGTPNDLANRLVELSSLKETDTILEPSAGQGSIINAIHRFMPDAWVYYCELLDTNLSTLSKIKNSSHLCDDFMLLDNNIKYNKIIANPPFSKNQDIDHVTKMYNMLADNGRLVSITGKHWKLSKNKKETEFRKWLTSKNATIVEIEDGTFKASGTNVGGYIIIIDKVPMSINDEKEDFYQNHVSDDLEVILPEKAVDTVVYNDLGYMSIFYRIKGILNDSSYIINEQDKLDAEVIFKVLKDDIIQKLWRNRLEREEKAITIISDNYDKISDDPNKLLELYKELGIFATLEDCKHDIEMFYSNLSFDKKMELLLNEV